MMKHKYLIAVTLIITSLTGFSNNNLDTLQSIPWLPDPLMYQNKTAVKTTEDWNKQKEWIKDQLQKYYLGYMPPIPRDVNSKLINEQQDGQVEIKTLRLSFGKGNKAQMTVKLFIPDNIGPKAPVFMTQWNHRSWLGIGLRRGYIGCLYAAADVKDDTEGYEKIYPEYSFKRLMQRTWGATAVVSYLHSLEIVDTNQIAISGHSRNGKQSLYVAAFDERVDALIPSSSGFGGVKAARLCGRRFSPHTMGHTFHDFPDWFLHSLKDFVGNHDKLPVDLNSLVSIVAPRPLLLNAGIFDLYGDSYGLEQTYKSAGKAYHFLDADNNLQIRQVVSRHTTQARDIEEFFDFLDTQFGRKIYPPFNDRYHNYSFDEWLKKNPQLAKEKPVKVDVSQENDLSTNLEKQIRDNIKWLLGPTPIGITNPGPKSMNARYQREDDVAEIFRQQETIGNAERLLISPYDGLGDNLFADLYYPPTGKDKYPLVIYLHEYTYNYGYGKTSYPGFEMNRYIKELTDSGFAVLAFDMIGFGSRQREAIRFYERYPEWSLMGKMVEDVKAAIDVAYGLPIVDTSRIILSGYQLGAKVGLFASALDNRIDETALVSPFTPFRSSNNEIEGIRHFYDFFGLIPRLGLYEGNKKQIPVDLQEILSVIEGKTFLLVNSKSRHIELDKMKRNIKAAQKHKKNIEVKYYDEIDHFYGVHRKLLMSRLRD